MEECICCKIAKGDGCGFQKIIVNMEGGWVLNHFFADEGTYLGRLVLGTKEHQTDFGKLSEKEATTLGTNIQSINHSLRQYWAKIYPKDPIELVHVAYLNETPHINRHVYLLSKEQLSKESHVHLHLLPRTKEMGEALGYCAEKIGFHLVDVDNVKKFPLKYRNLDENDIRVINLMNYLKESLSE